MARAAILRSTQLTASPHAPFFSLVRLVPMAAILPLMLPMVTLKCLAFRLKAERLVQVELLILRVAVSSERLTLSKILMEPLPAYLRVERSQEVQLVSATEEQESRPLK